MREGGSNRDEMWRGTAKERLSKQWREMKEAEEADRKAGIWQA